ncbi:phage holin family protein [Defluviimonas sp. D31]|uniref:phage holin family protein n=1 Tax=Defluviimonas sp. D31 TaxID=3083253 RepID=UPI00296E93D8|nr:phage holin family protein [Defluviimonas sp. D31]MDW4550892.1 phage holin family protein [Defluviimonas sp. D31]
MTGIPDAISGALDALFGGAAALGAAAAGRLMYHSGEVKGGRRRFLSRELAWEIPVAVGMAIVGRSLADYLGLGANVSTGLVAVLAYLGPRGSEALIERLLRR